MPIHTRFAPSPTGDLHVGGARTALYAWLYAKKNKGDFLLRIEDTDVERSTQGAIDIIFEAMQWLGLMPTSEVIFQSKRTARYQEALQQLLDAEQAYYCSCSKERLVQLRETQLAAKQKPRYDGHCRQQTCVPSADKPCVVRFKNPQQGQTVFDDLIYGTLSFDNQELDDLIIARSDGSPTYNFCVVIDDLDMKITHVIRGNDHINNTPRQINIMHALGAQEPIYAHVPMILGDDGKRLSKRHGATGIMQYRDQGYLPQALLNYLVRLGWSHGDQEIFSVDEMIQHFDLDHISKSDAAFNSKKLQWLNQHYIKNSVSKDLIKELQYQLALLNITEHTDEQLLKIIDAQKERVKTIKEMAEKSSYLYTAVQNYDALAVEKHFNQDTASQLNTAIDRFNSLKRWDQATLHTAILALLEKMDIKMVKLAQPIRIALTGNTQSPSLDVTLSLLDKEEAMQRLEKAVVFCQHKYNRG